MAFILADRVQETATANTTVSFTLSGAMTSYQSFAAIGNGNTTYYGATDGTNWEVGFGTYSTSPNTLTRTTILSSSNSGSAVTFSGTVTVWCDYPAGKQISSDYPNALGVVTPAAGTFTTITGQTEVLKGTGENFITYSQTFQNAAWTKQTNVTATDNATTAPDGTSTAASIAWGSASNGTGLYNLKTGLSWSGISNTKSIYVRADVGGGTVTMQDPGTTSGTTTATLTTSWQRVTLTESAQTTGAGVWIQKTASSPSTIYVWGGQLEIGSTANTYVPTTTTAIYGTPTLSFSGVAGLGLQSDGSLYVSPAGTGALQAQATTSSTVGGNARGANSVDWQTSRSAASQVTSGSSAVIAGGYNNTVSVATAVISGGSGNTVTGQLGGVLSGNLNQSQQYGAVVGGGQSNTASGLFNFIGSGYTNSGTASSAVTTQSATMNGTTTVTLSGSNASIKVGQLIFGTYITFPTTYVAAISGTTLTLSQVASGSGTATLSFYTPHGVVVGGGNNQATGSYSFIGGGGDAGTSSNRNVASGDWSFVGGGRNNTASGSGSFVGGGGVYPTINNTYPNTASGTASAIVGGLTNSASNDASFIGGGQQNSANASYSAILGGAFGTTRSIIGNHAFSACYAPIAFASGVSQSALLVLGAQTTDATATVLRSNTSAASGTNQVILPNNSAYYFKGSVVATSQFVLTTTAATGTGSVATLTFAAQTQPPYQVGATITVAGVSPSGYNGTFTVTACTTTTVSYSNATSAAQTVAGTITGTYNSAMWSFEGGIQRQSSAAGTRLVGTPQLNRVATDPGASAWSIAITADTTNGGLAITVTGVTATTIRWVAKLETTEVTF